MQNEELVPPKKALFIQVLLVVIIVAGYFFIDFNSIYNSLRGDGEFITQNKKCDLRAGPCEVVIQDGTKFSLEIFPKDLPLMTPLKFKVTSSIKDLKNLQLKIYATNMMMGEYILSLKSNEDGTYETTGTLPTCPVGFMKWNADIEISKINKIIGARFKFETDI